MMKRLGHFKASLHNSHKYYYFYSYSLEDAIDIAVKNDYFNVGYDRKSEINVVELVGIKAQIAYISGFKIESDKVSSIFEMPFVKYNSHTYRGVLFFKSIAAAKKYLKNIAKKNNVQYDLGDSIVVEGFKVFIDKPIFIC